MITFFTCTFSKTVHSNLAILFWMHPVLLNISVKSQIKWNTFLSVLYSTLYLAALKRKMTFFFFEAFSWQRFNAEVITTMILQMRYWKKEKENENFLLTTPRTDENFCHKGTCLITFQMLTFSVEKINVFWVLISTFCFFYYSFNLCCIF